VVPSLGLPALLYVVDRFNCVCVRLWSDESVPADSNKK